MEHRAFCTEGERLLKQVGPTEKLAGGYFFTEGPVWSRGEEMLYFTNFADNTIYSLKPGQPAQLFRANSGRAVGLSIRQDGTLVSAETSSHAVTLAYARHSEIIADQYEGKRLNSPNDVIVRKDGSVLFTDPYSVAMGGPRELDYNGFYLVRWRNGAFEKPILLGMMERPNGLAYSPDEQILYVNDTNQNVINAYQMHQDDRASFVGVFAKLDTAYGPGAADGMKVDTQGRVYVTGPGGIWVFDNSGAPLMLLRFADVVGNFCFGGLDGCTLFVTASAAVYSVRIGMVGILP